MIIPPEQRSCWGVYWFHSVRLSVRLSRLPCPLCNIYSSRWILSILVTNDRYHERVCRTQWPLTLTYIFKVIRPCLENRVRSVAFTVLDGLFLCLAQMITIIRGCVACYVLFRIWKFEFLANFSALTLKKNLQFSMDSFHIWYKWSLVWESVLHIMTFDLDMYLQGHSTLTMKIVSAL